jgi:hypothetical protein
VREMRDAAVDLGASRNRAAAQEDELRRSADRLRIQAEQAVAAAKDELGRDALRLRGEAIAHADDLAAEQAQLRAWRAARPRAGSVTWHARHVRIQTGRLRLTLTLLATGQTRPRFVFCASRRRVPGPKVTHDWPSARMPQHVPG